MKAGHGKWSSFLAFFYYVSGAVYYGYKWFLIFGLSGLAATGIELLIKQPTIVVCLTAVSSIAAIIVGIGFWRRLYKMQMQSQNPALKIRSITVDYTFLDSCNCDYQRAAKGTTIFPTDHYVAKFFWSGSGTVTPVAVEGASSVVTDGHSTDLRDQCRVNFGRLIPKGQNHSFSYKLELRNATKTIRPFLGQTITSPLDKLLLRVKFHSGQKISTYRRHTFISNTAEIFLKEEVVSINGVLNEAVWEIPKPQVGFYYRISWQTSEPSKSL